MREGREQRSTGGTAALHCLLMLGKFGGRSHPQRHQETRLPGKGDGKAALRTEEEMKRSQRV